MPSPIAETLAVLLLGATLGWAIIRPRGLPEAVVAVPAAGLLLVLGVLPLGQAGSEARSLAPTIGFLAAVLVLASLCDRYGLFEAAGSWMAAGSRGRPVSLLALVFAAASVVTAVLSLDATVVLLTPVVFATVARLRLRAKPHVYACTHLANSASLLLPVSNLTNLLAFGASGLSFARFGATMALPWLAAIGVEWLVLRRFFAGDLVGRGETHAVTQLPVPVFPTIVVALTLAGFFVTSALNVSPAFAALAGAVVLAVPAIATRRTGVQNVALALDLPFLAFVLALGLIVKAISLHGLGSVVTHLVPGGAGLGSLLAIAALAAVLSNVINNLPAALLLLPAVSGAGAGPVLAVLIGVNTGPNLTYVGSLATLLWRRVLIRRGEELPISEFLRLGALTVPPVLVTATLALWISLRLVG
ncbi:MAG TPA: SLC13 family permease [Candidatus Saccharimonadales bacterium]|nr:SLC13 family permease [Candidatus Saccharimonadales bacterium]